MTFSVYLGLQHRVGMRRLQVVLRPSERCSQPRTKG